jgi:hypothetical protein
MKRAAVSAIGMDPSIAPFDDTGFATIAEYCRELQASRPTIDRLLREGLPHVDLGSAQKRCIRIPRAAAMAWLRHRGGQ